jgi:hypothetical protein
MRQEIGRRYGFAVVLEREVREEVLADHDVVERLRIAVEIRPGLSERVGPDGWSITVVGVVASPPGRSTRWRTRR